MLQTRSQNIQSLSGLQELGTQNQLLAPLIKQPCSPSVLSKIRLVRVYMRNIQSLTNRQQLHIIQFDGSMILAIPKLKVGSKIDNPAKQVTINTRGSSNRKNLLGGKLFGTMLCCTNNQFINIRRSRSTVILLMGDNEMALLLIDCLYRVPQYTPLCSC